MQYFNGHLVDRLLILLSGSEFDAAKKEIEVCLNFLKESAAFGYKKMSSEKDFSAGDLIGIVRIEPSLPLEKEKGISQDCIDQLIGSLVGHKYPKNKNELDLAIKGLALEESRFTALSLGCIRLHEPPSLIIRFFLF